MSLHILSASPFENSCLAECRRVLTAGDALLLSADGVQALRGDFLPELADLHAAGIAIFALAEDCAARGLDGQMPEWAVAIDYGGFVDLVVAHPRSVSWF